MEYIYPKNLKSQAMLGLWKLQDILIIGVTLVFGIFVFARTKLMLFSVYAFLTIRFEDVSVKDFLVYAKVTTRYDLECSQKLQKMREEGILKSYS